MSEDDAGFSFGFATGAEGDAPAEVDAIEVSGEPVSRNEAKDMGFVQFDTTHEAKAGTAVFNAKQLQDGLSADLALKLENARQHLKKNEIDAALTLAQEIVWESPSLVEAKIIIARCFINTKEYPKALSILHAIDPDDATAETHYYAALCQSRNGKVKEALDSLKLAKALPTDPATRKRITDLALQLQGEQVVCPVCGKKVLYDSLVDVGDMTVCANCAKNMPEDVGGDDEDGEDYDDEEDEEGGKRRKRLRPPLTKTDILMRLAAAVLLVILLFVGLWVMSFLAPEYYGMLRSFLPADWTFLPAAGNVTSMADIEAQVEATRRAQQQPTLSFDSPALANAIAGVELRHRVFVEGMEQRGGKFAVAFSPEPAAKAAFDADTGELVWTPAAQDAGKTFTVSFDATFNSVRVRQQANTVAVGAGPDLRSLCPLVAPEPGQISHLLAVDMDQDGKMEVVSVSGLYREGRIYVVEESAEGVFQPVSEAVLPGRPAGAGVVMADAETWLAVADYWNSRLRYYSFRGGNISEMAVDVDLPGQPVMAGFEREASMSAVICRAGDALELVCYRQMGQLRTETAGQWTLPPEFVWRSVVILPGDAAAQKEPVPVVAGGVAAGGIIAVDIAGNKLVPQELTVPGRVVRAAAGAGGKLHCLVENEGRVSIVTFTPSLDGKVADVVVSEGGERTVEGNMAAVAFFPRSTAPDVAVMSSVALGIAFSRSDGTYTNAGWWDIPAVAPLHGPVAPAPATQYQPARLFYTDTAGKLWVASMVEPAAATAAKEAAE